MKTKDSIEEKQENNKNNEYVAKKEIKRVGKKVDKMGDRQQPNLHIKRVYDKRKNGREYYSKL